MVNVCINGYGTIGKRVAEVIARHEKLKLLGVSKYSPDSDAKLAVLNCFKVFVPREKVQEFQEKKIPVAGTVDELLDASDLVIDCSPDKTGEKNKAVYSGKGKKAVFQGGEEEGIGFSFNARSNFDDAKGKQFVRVVSCNTTGYCRILKPLGEKYKIESVFATLIRRGADLNDSKGSALNSVDWKANSHHADDVKSVLKGVKISSVAFKVPNTHAHINSLLVKFNGNAPSKDELRELYKGERVVVLEKAKSSSQVIEAARDLGLKRFDLFMPCILLNTVMTEGDSLFLTFITPQESIVVPENVDAAVAQTGVMGRKESMDYTDELMGLKDTKAKLEKVFS